jgi:hypothetical protein
MFTALIVVSVIALALVAAGIYQEYTRKQERDAFSKEREAFAAERKGWVNERRDLNNRLQAPDAAPYFDESGEEMNPTDYLPVMPEFTLDEGDLDRARKALAEVGYEEGPAL